MKFETEKDIIEFVEGIMPIDIVIIDEDLSEIQSLENRLNYLKELKKSHYDKLINIEKEIRFTKLREFFVRHKEQFYLRVFKDNPLDNNFLSAPVRIIEKHFSSEELKSCGFSFWFLKYYAEQVFNNYVNQSDFIEEIKSDMRESNLRRRLNKINDFETKVKDLLERNELDVYNYHRNNFRYHKEIAVIRVKMGNYFQNHFIENLCWGSDEVQAYFEYILLKPYLEKLLKKGSSGVKNSGKQNPTPYLKDLFSESSSYDFIVNKLVEEGFVVKEGNRTFKWKGTKEDSSLGNKTLICTLILVLDEKDYLISNLKKNYISKALSNTFDIPITAKTYGETTKNYLDKKHYSKPFHFIN